MKKSILILMLLMASATISNAQLHYYGFDEIIELTYQDKDILVKFTAPQTEGDVQHWAETNHIWSTGTFSEGAFIPETFISRISDKEYVLENILHNEGQAFANSYDPALGDVEFIHTGFMLGPNSGLFYSARITFKAKEGATIEAIHAFTESHHMTWVETTASYEMYEISGFDALQVANELQETGLTTYSTPDFIGRAELFQYIPNDQYFINQYGFHNNLQAVNGNIGTLDADADAPEAWDISKGSSSILVAVLDQGVPAVHPDLPLIRQVRLIGSNFAAPYDPINSNPDDPEPTLNNAHGISCAGLIAATMDNNEGISGMAPNCKIMPVRIPIGFTIPPISFATAFSQPIDFAWQKGADIISNSWGISTFGAPSSNLFPVIVTAISNATTMGRDGLGCPVLFATGNTANHNEGFNGYIAFPANANVPGLITVGASDLDDKQTNYSPNSDPFSSKNQIVDVVAPSHKAYCETFPGVSLDVWTTDIPGATGYNPISTGSSCYSVGFYIPSFGTNADAYSGTFGGTSASTPLTAGICALVLSTDPSLDKIAVYNNIICSAQDVGPYTYSAGFTNKMGNGRVNAFNSLMNLCIPNLNITWPIPAGQTIKYQAANFITTNALVNNTSQAEEKANDYVLMQPGFEATTGSVYSAFISPCTACVTDGATKQFAMNNNSSIGVQQANQRKNNVLKLYPNPADNLLNIEYMLANNVSGKILITDLLGRTLKTIVLAEETVQTQVDISELTSGAYFVNLVESGKLTETKKIIVTK